MVLSEAQPSGRRTGRPLGGLCFAGAATIAPGRGAGILPSGSYPEAVEDVGGWTRRSHRPCMALRYHSAGHGTHRLAHTQKRSGRMGKVMAAFKTLSLVVTLTALVLTLAGQPGPAILAGGSLALVGGVALVFGRAFLR